MNKFIYTVIMLLLSFSASADSVRTSDGSSCSFDSDDTAFEVSTYLEKNRTGSSTHDTYYLNNYGYQGEEMGVRVSYKFGGPKRLDCNHLYQLELREKRAKIQLLEAKTNQLKKAQSINWD